VGGVVAVFIGFEPFLLPPPPCQLGSSLKENSYLACKEPILWEEVLNPQNEMHLYFLPPAPCKICFKFLDFND